MGFHGQTRTKRIVQGMLMAAAIMTLEVSLAPRVLVFDHVHAQAADDLPEAPNKGLVIRKCTQCHAAAVFSSQRRPQSAWDETIAKMQSKGLVVTDDEYDKILTYLSTNLAPAGAAAPATINVNTSSAADLQKGLDLTGDEADAIVKARTAKGNFKDWHEVAAVEGVDAKKIEAKKDLLAF